MQTLKALFTRLRGIRDEAEALLNTAEKENDGNLTEEQKASFDALMAERKNVEDNITRLEEFESLSTSAGRVTSDPVIEVGKERKYDDPLRGFRHVADFARAVKSACSHGGQVDPRLADIQKEEYGFNIQAAAPTNFHRETSSADGYMVPPQIREEVWRLVFESENLMSRFNPEPTESNTVQLSVDESTPWSTDGVQAKWASEGDQLTTSRLKTAGRTIHLHKLFAFVSATEELVEDAPRLNSRLTEGAAAAISYKADDSLINGDGVGKPLGILNATPLISVAKETNQAAATIVAENVAKMYGRMLRAGLRNPFWLVNQDALQQLLTMKIGDNAVYTLPQVGFTQAPGGFLFGIPVVFSEHCQTVGTLGDIYLIAPNGYYATTKVGGMKFASSIHLYFDYGVEAFRWTFRLGGEPYLSAAVSKDNGASTLSHFVALATRSS